MSRSDALTNGRVVEWLVPGLLGLAVTVGSGTIGMLWLVVDRLSDINSNLKVAVQRVDELDRRVTNLETLYFKRSNP